MKPFLDAMIAKVVNSLSGDARSFYNREFSFFNEVTSISGKLKPYIKKTKPEKKVRYKLRSKDIAFLNLLAPNSTGQDRRRNGKDQCGRRGVFAK